MRAKLVSLTAILFAFGTVCVGAAQDKTASPAPAASTAKSYPYLLSTCPVSGEKLGEMGDAVVKTIDGREVRFCCNSCVAKFEADKATYWKKIDADIIKTQGPHYPLTHCVVETDDELKPAGETKNGETCSTVDYVYNN
ncbi:MAG TPA: hypothetical protein VG711_10920, partial [Phycisphaerales bacterium]|nr:hypothetical protein [Phycisphaerales bacterium]